ncbi:MAG: hypothetical protein U0793_07395 [Gemmataceae bacterium]
MGRLFTESMDPVQLADRIRRHTAAGKEEDAAAKRGEEIAQARSEIGEGEKAAADFHDMKGHGHSVACATALVVVPRNLMGAAPVRPDHLTAPAP